MQSEEFKPYQNENNSVKDTRERKRKKHVTLSWKFPWKYFSTTPLPFPSSNSIILKAFLKTFSHQNEAYLMSSQKKKARKDKKEGTRMTVLRNLTFCIWIRRPHGGHFCFRTSRPQEFPIQGELVINPTPPPPPPSRNLEVTSTELRWTGQEARKNQVILSKGRNASCHLPPSSTQQNLKDLLISRVTGQLCMQWE